MSIFTTRRDEPYLVDEEMAQLLLDSRRISVCCSNACSFHSRIIFNLLQIVAEKNLALHRRAMITARRTTREKLMAYLMTQARQARSSSFTIPFDRQALADFLGVERSAMSAEISRMRISCERASACSRGGWLGS